MKSFMNVVLGCTLSVLGFSASANADVLANWTFETSFPGLVLNNSAASPNATAEAGIYQSGSIANGAHISVNADWSSPAGNGSLHSFSGNEWAVGDYWQFSTESTSYENVTIAWDQTGSATGPRNFQLQYSTDGSTFSNFVSYSLASPAVSWSTVAPVVTTSFSFDLSSILALNNDSSIYFRLAVENNIAINGTTVAAGGTDRIDNVVVSGTAVPAPGALALLGLSGLVGRNRRRR
jgi:hypothetical protein